MNFRKRKILGIILFYISDFFLSVYIVMLFFRFGMSQSLELRYILAGIVMFLLMRSLTFLIGGRYYYRNRIDVIMELVGDFKKGRFIQPQKSITGNDELATVFNELQVVGRHLDDIVSSQKNEIEKFRELYNSIVFSINSFFVVLDAGEEVVFASEGFCRKFGFTQDEVAGQKVELMFQFMNARLKGAIDQVATDRISIVLEKVHIFSRTNVSVIADIKISSLSIHGKNQIILIIEDVTSSLQKDYQISLISHISQSMQRDDEIEHMFFSLLTGVTSGSGLGFNRAMLFLVDETGERLQGAMSVGPDSLDEAVTIWSSMAGNQMENAGMDNPDERSGRELREKVASTIISLKETNLFTEVLHSGKTQHLTGIWNTTSIDDKLKKLLDVDEAVVAPMIAMSSPVGVIIADNKFNHVPVSRENMELLGIFASQAAISIENYRNLSSTRKELTKIQEKQDAMVESEKMAAVGRIAAHIAHEIRNPLVTMGGFARRIHQRSSETAELKSIHKAAGIILAESERLEKTLSNVMDFTRPSRQIREFNDVNEVVEDTLTLLKNLFLENQIQVDPHLEQGLPLVKSDFNQLKQVTLNLLQNAVEATPRGGRISITTKSSPTEVTLLIADNGPGIDADDPNIIFEPFYTTKVTGTGLGLAIVKRIIMEHEGDITAANGDESGVIFTISLPLPK